MENTAITTVDQLGGYYKKHSSRLKKSIDKINEKVKKETKEEMQLLEMAYEKYQKKVEDVMKDQEIIEEHKNIEISSAKMKKALTLATKKFFTKREKIYSDSGFTSKEKRERELELYNQMLDSFFDEDEKAFFQQIIKNNMALVVNQKELKGSKVMKILE
jgi:phage terminase small subunit